jgi:hypothetical protein
MRRLLLLAALPGCKLFVDPTIPETCEDLGSCGGGDGGGDTAAAGDEDGDGFTVEDGDCDDADPAVNPDAVEVCGGADEDCDGLVDEADPDLVDIPTVYADADGDGWGAGPGVTACDPPSGTTLLDGDCDDTDAAVSPGATEVCRNGVDDDCDGTANGCRPWDGVNGRAEAGGAVVANATSVYFGWWAGAGDVDGDGERELVTTDPEAGPVDNGVVSAYSGLQPGAVVSASSGSSATFLGPSGTYQGVFLAVGDVTGDGEEDLAFGSDAATVHVLPGPLSGTMRTGDAWLIATGLTGWSLDADPLLMADATGDGRTDLLVGDPYNDALYVIPGPLPRRTGAIADLATRKLTGGSTGSPGWTLAAGDFAGDGVTDIATGDPRAGTATRQAGRVWLLRDGVPSGGNVDDLVHTADGDRDGAGFGGALEACDLDGDGADDLVVGAAAAYSDEKGAVYIFFGGFSGATSATGADLRIDTGGAEGALGYALACGDFDGDGTMDLAVGEPSADVSGTTDGGAVHVWYGPLDADHSTEDADATLTGGADRGFYGVAVTGLGDLDGDGADDLAVTGEITALDVLFGGGL